jgi:F0F1-type ATP synthase assembly protein I
MILGYLLDRGIHTTPVFTLVGLALGVATAASYAYTEVRKIFGSGDD